MRWLVPILAGTLLLMVLAAASAWWWRAEEDARGAREWEATKARLAARGDPVDFRTLIPPPVPDDQNLGVIPLFHVQYDADRKSMEPVRLETALRDIFPTSTTLHFGNFFHGEQVDRAKLDRFLSEQFKKTFPGRAVPPSPLDQVDALCPALNDLRQAAAARTQCRFDREYITRVPGTAPLGGITVLIQLARVIDLDAVTALQANDSARALADIDTTLKLDAGARKEPILVSGLVAIGVTVIQLNSLWQGLASHTWNDAQLAEIQRQLAQVDFLADYQLCMRGEALGNFGPMVDYLRTHREDTVTLLQNMNAHEKPLAALVFIWSLMPSGWFDLTKARGVTLYMDAARQSIDLGQRRACPEKYAAIQARAESLQGVAFSDYILHFAAPPVLAAAPVFCQAQFHVDTARLACMLERYRLAHGAYPASLDLLAPYAEAGLPHDVCNGQPYHYKLRTDGTYLLYSVGWNQTDDGGKVVYKVDQPKAADRFNGDWVWPQPGHPGL